MRTNSPSLVLTSTLLLVAACSSSSPAPEWATPERPAPSLVESAEDPTEEATTPTAPPVDAPVDSLGVTPADEPIGAPRPEAPAAVAGEDEPSPEASAPSEAHPPLAWVAGTPVSAGALLSEWYWVAGRDLWLVFDKVVAMRLATVEAQRLGVRIAPELVELRVAEENRRLATEVAALGPEMSVEEFLRQRHGFEAESYFRHMRTATIRQMVAERAVRAWTLSNEWARLRLIVVAEESTMGAIQAELAAGADFATLAREHSLDDTKEAGGLVPFLVRQEHSPLARIAFGTPLGETAGPIEVSGHHALIQVLERHAPLEGTWPDTGAQVEATLAEHPLTDAEFLHWKLQMEKRYPVDASPLEALLLR